MSEANNLVAFPPESAQEGSAQRSRPGLLRRMRTSFYDWFQWRLSRLANRLGVPGVVCNVDIEDKVTGQHLTIKAGYLFTKISIDGRDYYFHRWSGRFDGTGMCMCACPPKQPAPAVDSP